MHIVRITHDEPCSPGLKNMLKRKWKNRKRREEAWVESLKMRGGGDCEKAVVPVGEANVACARYVKTQ